MLIDLDGGDIISEEFSVIGGTASFAGTLNATRGDIAGWDILNGMIEATGDNQSFVRMISSGGRPEFHLRAKNGEDLHIGGDYSFDNESDITITQSDFTPNFVDIEDDNSGDWSNSDTHTYSFANPSSLEGRNLRFTTSQEISANAVDVAGETNVASANCTITFRLLDSTDTIIDEWTDSDNVSTQSGQVFGGANLSVSTVIPSGQDFAKIQVYWSLSTNTTGSNTTAAASMDVDSPPATIIGTAEFLSPLGLQLTNEGSSQSTKPRVKLERNTGQILGHEHVVEGPNG
jgi:hypothetical protein